MLSTAQELPWTPDQRAAAMSNMQAAFMRLGTPPVFLTISIDDIYSNLAIRLAVASTNNREFPADEHSARELLRGLREGQQTIATLDMQYEGLHDLIASNPVATTQFFQLVERTLYEHLLGVPMDGASRRTPPLASRSCGAYGQTIEALHVVESQSRMTLHLHMLVWAVAGAHQLELAAGVAERAPIVQALIETIATQFVSHLPAGAHAAGVLAAKVRAPQTRASLLPHQLDATYNNRRARATQIHGHQDTCWKGAEKLPAGVDATCRSAYGRADVLRADVLQLDAVRTHAGAGGKERWGYTIREAVEPPPVPADALANPDQRLLVFELERPPATLVGEQRRHLQRVLLGLTTESDNRPAVVAARRMEYGLELADVAGPPPDPCEAACPPDVGEHAFQPPASHTYSAAWRGEFEAAIQADCVPEDFQALVDAFAAAPAAAAAALCELLDGCPEFDRAHAYLVSHTDCINAVFGSNSAAYPLGTKVSASVRAQRKSTKHKLKQAPRARVCGCRCNIACTRRVRTPLCNVSQSQGRAIFFYLAKYMSKNANEPAAAAVLLQEATRRVEAHPSTAADAATNPVRVNG